MAFAIAVLIAVFIETVAVHFLLRLWSPVAAWILTATALVLFMTVPASLQHYVASRLLWNPYLDTSRLIAEYKAACGDLAPR